ncbi:MAG TPA: TonB-dependent receptor, partial [Vicinamibacterales bacterium]|nr:TonB-dependent receptor [Vicinamibacterales bacterium]
MVRVARFSFLIALILSVPSFAAAQLNTGTITGIVKDSQGGVLPGASVKIVRDGTERTSDLITGGDGSYRSEPLDAGAYRVAASLDGFETIERRITLGAGQTIDSNFTLGPARFTQSVVVTARRVEEVAQDVPIPVSVVRGDLVSDAGAFNVNRMKEMIPTVQFYSTNPRNSAINIRGLGAPFGLTNDGLEPGVGMYIDGVFYARPASASLDFLDVDQVEVLRGPEGTLFGKNTTAGAINITTRKPSFTRGVEAEVNYGTLDFVQAKASVTGGLSKTIAGRLSF